MPRRPKPVEPTTGESFVYVIAAGPQGPVKVGFSADPDRRLRQLQTGHPERLEIFHRQGFDAARAPLMEKLVHKLMAPKRCQGEWFAYTVEDAVAEVEFSLIRYGEHQNLRYFLGQ
jgi:hypothetical protein